MNLQEIQEMCVELSGREDLAASGKFNFYIQSGQRYLERKVNFKKARATNVRLLEGGLVRGYPRHEYMVVVPSCRVVERVRVAEINSTSWRELTKTDLDFMKRTYGGPLQNVPKALPKHYAIVSLRLSPGSTEDRPETGRWFDGYSHFIEVTAGDHFAYTGILVFPLPKAETHVEVEGLYYEPLLENPEDVNYWSSQHSDLLIYSALRQMEISYRNTQGVRDWDNAIRPALIDYEFDYIDEEIFEVSQMEG